MKKETYMITSEQCRAARGLLDWTQAQLADAVGLSALSIRTFEKGGAMRASNQQALRNALEAAGVAFIEPNGGGPGVRLRLAN